MLLICSVMLIAGFLLGLRVNAWLFMAVATAVAVLTSAAWIWTDGSVGQGLLIAAATIAFLQIGYLMALLSQLVHNECLRRSL